MEDGQMEGGREKNGRVVKTIEMVPHVLVKGV